MQSPTFQCMADRMPAHPTATPLIQPALFEALTTTALRAAAAITSMHPRHVEQRLKSDLSPVTVADQAANAVITQEVRRLLPDLPMISEEDETTNGASGSHNESCVLVDPLDGTREFLAGRDEFTVNIAIIAHGQPIVGIVAAPALGLIWRGMLGHGAERLSFGIGTYTTGPACVIRTRLRTSPALALVSRSHFDARSDEFLRGLSVTATLACGSSLKFCRIAQGDADIYVRLAPTHEWDIAAGQAVLTAAGGIVTTPGGAELRYGKAERFLVPGFIAWANPATAVAAIAKQVRD